MVIFKSVFIYPRYIYFIDNIVLFLPYNFCKTKHFNYIPSIFDIRFKIMVNIFIATNDISLQTNKTLANL